MQSINKAADSTTRVPQYSQMKSGRNQNVKQKSTGTAMV
jgi:hypothetical protein